METTKEMTICHKNMLMTILSISVIILDFFALNFALFKITLVYAPTYKATQIASEQFLR